MKNFFFILFLSLLAHAGLAQDTEDPRRQFDFWVGEWDVYSFGTDTIVGKSLITSVMDGNAIREAYSSTLGPYQGTSLNSYHPQNQHWKQYYVDNEGLTLEITGTFQEGKMILEDSTNQITWYRMMSGSIRQTWVSKVDGSVWFDGEYKPRKD